MTGTPSSSHSDDDDFTHISNSMVSIKPPSPPAETEAERDEQARYRLIYSKSKVYVHPTAYARDNIPGFVSIVKRDSISPTYFLTWVPESLLGERGNEEWTKFLRVEAEYGSGAHSIDEEEDAVLIKPPIPKGESYAFSIPLSSIYSAVVQLPTISSWYGSMTFNLTSGATLQTIYFHDEESRSISQLSPKNRAASGIASWGGEDLLQRLKSYCHILRSTLQPNLFLFDPSKPDIEAHTMVLFDDDAADLIMAQSADSPIPHHRRPQRPSQESRTPGSGGSSSGSIPSPRLTPNGSPAPFPNPRYSTRTSVLHETLPTYPPTTFTPLTSPSRTSLLQSFSQLTRATRHAAQQILSHPLAQPIVPHLPSPMQSLVNASGEWAGLLEKGGMGEFEAARVYLARWARVVAEEGERARRREARVVGGSGGDREEGELGVFELLAKSANLPTPKSTRHPKDAIDKTTWLGWFDETGRPKISEEEMLKEVFRRGFATMEARRLAWPSVLKVLPWDIDEQTREQMWAEKRQVDICVQWVMTQYEEIKAQWFGIDEVLQRPEVAEERHRVDVDVRRTDRTQPLFALPDNPAANENAAQAASNEHVDRLGTILLSYNFYEKELGYVQGMSDLCAPIYVVSGADEVKTFWCFVEVMEHMKQNFLRDQSGMKKQLSALQQLLSVMDPELYRHLEKADALNLFFCFRWVLISFKREFPFDDVLRLWEVLWTNYYTNQFVLFVALAVLESHRDVIIRYLIEFDEILKYCNDLSMTIELDSTLAQAEVLFLSFQQIVADIDRRQTEQGLSSSPGGLRRRRGDSRPNSPTSLPPGASEEDRTKAVLSMSLISDDLRELLQR
ncbi:GTPase-activating protein Gyp7 [Rhizoctonia solani 123E]|uniref:GTPase-activating protein Gyp7 n=1 Tax=Rhizoctonia solani 123E TaxID=1423351 RepID=A0A074RFP2_9AGAM|nr:GTPase-activating protein Gyp7 [Rhizoctonia solani 123E]